MAEVPDDLRYTKDHEWVKDEGDLVRVGITDYAQEQLGDIVFVEIEPVGTKVKKGGKLGVVESVKSASDIYAPISGEVIELNDVLADAPETVNEGPYEKGWMALLKPDDKAELEGLMDAASYRSEMTH